MFTLTHSLTTSTKYTQCQIHCNTLKKGIREHISGDERVRIERTMKSEMCVVLRSKAVFTAHSKLVVLRNHMEFDKRLVRATICLYIIHVDIHIWTKACLV